MICSTKLLRRAAVPAACLTVLVTPAESAQDTVKLAFAWPDRLSGKVDYEVIRTKKVGDKTQKISMTGNYDMIASAVSDGLMIETKNVRLKVKGAAVRSAPQAKLQKFIIKAASTPPNFVVSRSGQYIRMHGLEKYRKNLREGVGGMVAEMPEAARQRVMQAIEPMISKAQLESGIVNNWNRDVGTWLDASFDRGDTYELKFNTKIPLFGNMSVPMVSRFRFVARVPCKKGSRKKDCVDLEARTSVESKAMAKALEKFIKQFSGNTGEAPVVKKFHLDTTIRLVTEPRTLIPHRMTSKKVSSAVIAMGGQERSSNQVEELRVAYKY